jgi:hypothetical protein
MTKMLSLVFVSAALLSGDQSYPGQPTQGKVWIQNRGRDEAMPVTLLDAASDARVKVQVVGTTAVQLAPQPWSYMRLVVSKGQDEIVALNKAGVDGWETTGLESRDERATTYILKRPR